MKKKIERFIARCQVRIDFMVYEINNGLCPSEIIQEMYKTRIATLSGVISDLKNLISEDN
ncbi:MAG: hypothetical protein WCY05_06265 [Candidatus Omnitrophota bacterium]